MKFFETLKRLSNNILTEADGEPDIGGDGGEVASPAMPGGADAGAPMPQDGAGQSGADVASEEYVRLVAYLVEFFHSTFDDIESQKKISKMIHTFGGPDIIKTKFRANGEISKKFIDFVVKNFMNPSVKTEIGSSIVSNSEEYENAKNNLKPGFRIIEADANFTNRVAYIMYFLLMHKLLNKGTSGIVTGNNDLNFGVNTPNDVTFSNAGKVFSEIDNYVAGIEKV